MSVAGLTPYGSVVLFAGVAVYVAARKCSQRRHIHRMLSNAYSTTPTNVRSPPTLLRLLLRLLHRIQQCPLQIHIRIARRRVMAAMVSTTATMPSASSSS